MELKDRINKLETDKLIDISKNYRQYGYDNETVNHVLTLLKDRGVSAEDLWLTGNLENKNYERAVNQFEAFKRNSATALFLYLLILLFKLSLVVHFSAWESYPGFLGILYFAAIAGYLFYLVRSFINQSALYQIAGDHYGTEGVMTYFFGGIPFYFISYFYFLRQMKEKMKTIK